MPVSMAEEWRNWATNQRARPVRVLAPATTDEVVAAVLDAAHPSSPEEPRADWDPADPSVQELAAGRGGLPVRMVGSGHSFSPVAVTGGVLLRPDRLRRIRSVDPDAGLVTVEAGCRLRELNAVLASHGLALTNLGDIDAQTIAGAIQTGTHGTGRGSGGLASQVDALEVVLADGTVTTWSAADHPDELGRLPWVWVRSVS